MKLVSVQLYYSLGLVQQKTGWLQMDLIPKIKHQVKREMYLKK